MQPSVQNGNSISAIVVPYLPLPTPSRLSISHSARPQPRLGVVAEVVHRLDEVVVLGYSGLDS